MRGGPNPAGGVPEVFLMLVVVNRILAPSSVEIAGCRIYILQGSKLCSPLAIRYGPTGRARKEQLSSQRGGGKPRPSSVPLGPEGKAGEEIVNAGFPVYYCSLYY